MAHKEERITLMEYLSDTEHFTPEKLMQARKNFAITTARAEKSQRREGWFFAIGMTIFSIIFPPLLLLSIPLAICFGMMAWERM